MVIRLWFKAFSLVLFSAFLHAAEIKPFTASYQIERNGDVMGQASISLHPIGGEKWNYITSSKAQVFIFAYSDTETSVVTWKNDIAIPLSFVRERRYPTKTSRVEQRFDWPSKTETGNKDGKKKWTLALEDGAQDRHSHTLLLRRDLKAGAKQMSYRISDGGKLRDYKYIVSGEETINTPTGPYKTLKVERDRDGDSRETIGWYAPDLEFIPVKMRQIENGKIQADMVLTKLEM